MYLLQAHDSTPSLLMPDFYLLKRKPFFFKNNNSVCIHLYYKLCHNFRIVSRCVDHRRIFTSTGLTGHTHLRKESLGLTHNPSDILFSFSFNFVWEGWLVQLLRRAIMRQVPGCTQLHATLSKSYSVSWFSFPISKMRVIALIYFTGVSLNYYLQNTWWSWCELFLLLESVQILLCVHCKKIEI